MIVDNVRGDNHKLRLKITGCVYFRFEKTGKLNH